MLIPTTKNTKTVTDLRENTLSLLRDTQRQGHLYIFHRSSPKAVIMSIEEFERINELIEDYLDELDAIQLAQEEPGELIPFKEVAKKYLKDKNV
ncbi:hypothetical protein A2956_00940 [Candidatus Roizmanbacteria bacterium RIFCSPLOWO2_01_FULL_37_57]|nr:MAG: hypothetical protein A3E10_04280 [Candidatus Roizmanbacteria bacterium RIFCSPHIGHO2_12_FULL_37_23]OGK44680.1 MAG: hypothetical protein A2956_00940 [Candidatus Roizmanbacteria bacterium RIFCSPLOWO2_01_FULL_37_57]